MLDIKLIRENPKEIKERLLAKEADFNADIDRILELDLLRRELISQSDNSKAEQKRVSKRIPTMKKAGEDTSAVMAQMKTLSDSIKELDERLREVEAEYNTLMLGLYNMPDVDLKPGGKENNEPIRYFGEPPTFDYEPKNHVDLCTDLGLIDYQRGAKLSGNGFWVYRAWVRGLNGPFSTILSIPILKTDLS